MYIQFFTKPFQLDSFKMQEQNDHYATEIMRKETNKELGVVGV